MGRQLTDGAEAGDLLFWTVTSGTVSNTASGARINGRCYQISASASVYKTLPTAVNEFFVRFAIYHSANIANQFQWTSAAGTVLGSIRRNATTGCYDLYIGASTLAYSGTINVPISTWHVVELHVKIADAGGVLEFKVEGTADGAGFSGDTKPGADTTAGRIYYIAPTTVSVAFLLDDIALNDTTGGADNTWCGDAHLYPLTLNGNGDSSQWVGSDSNSTDNYLLADEIPSNGDTDYVQSLTSGDKDLYNVTSLPSLPSGSTISRVVVETRAKELTAAGDSLQLLVKGGTGAGAPDTEATPVSFVLTTAYARQAAEFLVNPSTGAAWTETEVNNLQPGIKVP